MTAEAKYADHNREPFRTWLERQTCGLILLFVLVCQLFLACGGGGDTAPAVTDVRAAAPVYSDTVSLWTIKGDSSAVDFAERWTEGNMESNGRNGAKIDLFLDHPDERVLQNVILMVGGNNVGLNNESADTVIEKYARLYWSIRAERVFCVGISPFQGKDGFSPVKNPRIQEINEHIKGMCENYIDTWAMTPSFTDGVHHSEDYDRQIREAILYADFSSFTSGFSSADMRP